MFCRLVSCLLLVLAPVPLTAQSGAEPPRMNQIQVLGSHNSYKQAMDPELLEILRRQRPGRFEGVEYWHSPLEEQLDLGLRKLEIDVVYDPDGGRFARPWGLEILKQHGLEPSRPYDPDGYMRHPGLKVLHIPDFDVWSHVYTFRQALERLKAWSDQHPEHLPIAILMNAKDNVIDEPNLTAPLPFDAAAFGVWDAEIRAVLPPAKLITPDDVRGEYETLEKAVLAHAWPTLDEARGRFLFVLDEQGPKLEAYAGGHPSLHGRVMFVNAEPGRPEAAFCIVNNPVRSFDRIQQLVRAGYLVRTRSDADTREARSGDYSRMKAAFESGAHFVSTDYYLPAPFDSRFQVKLPGGGPGRWNPLLTPSLDPLPPLEP